MSIAGDLETRYRGLRRKFFPPPAHVHLASQDAPATPSPASRVNTEDRRRGQSDALAEAAKLYWRDFAEISRPKKSLRQILQETAAKYRVTVADILSHRQPRALLNARYEFYYRARNETPYSIERIGKFCGGRDHSTIINGINKHRQRTGAP